MNIADVYRHSLVIACDYRVPDPDRVGPFIERRQPGLARFGAHHVLVYRSTDDFGRVLVMLGVTSRPPVVELMQSRGFFDWFDAAGVEEIPAVFAGEIIERFDLTDPSSEPEAPGVVVAATMSVHDVDTLTLELRAALPRFRSAGIRKVWVFQALDDPQELMILQEIDDEDAARRWIDHPDAAADWMSDAGVGAYPPLFIGEFDRMVRVDGQTG